MDELDDMVAELWREMQPVALERARRLLAWAESGSPFPDELLNDAHKLAGSLGMYGLKEASDAARQLDQLARGGSAGPEVEAVARKLAAAVGAGR